MPDDLEDQINDLIESARERGPWKPGAYYNDAGDFVQALWSEAPYYGEWLNHRITLLRDQETKAVIGCQIWGLKGIVLKMPDTETKLREAAAAKWARTLGERLLGKFRVTPSESNTLWSEDMARVAILSALNEYSNSLLEKRDVEILDLKQSVIYWKGVEANVSRQLAAARKDLEIAMAQNRQQDSALRALRYNLSDEPNLIECIDKALTAPKKDQEKT